MVLSMCVDGAQTVLVCYTELLGYKIITISIASLLSSLKMDMVLGGLYIRVCT